MEKKLNTNNPEFKDPQDYFADIAAAKAEGEKAELQLRSHYYNGRYAQHIAEQYLLNLLLQGKGILLPAKNMSDAAEKVLGFCKRNSIDPNTLETEQYARRQAFQTISRDSSGASKTITHSGRLEYIGIIIKLKK